MRRKSLALLLSSLLTLSLFVGCGNKDINDTSNNNTDINTPVVEDNNDDATNTDNDIDSDNADENGNVQESKDIEEAVENKLEEAINKLYNSDYTNKSDMEAAIEYINNNFTTYGASSEINQIESYNNEISYSDFLITLVKEVDNINSEYKNTYEVRYNITIASGKPSVYTDIIAVLVIDNNDNVLIDSINEGNF